MKVPYNPQRGFTYIGDEYCLSVGDERYASNNISGPPGLHSSVPIWQTVLSIRPRISPALINLSQGRPFQVFDLHDGQQWGRTAYGVALILLVLQAGCYGRGLIDNRRHIWSVRATRRQIFA